MSDNIPKCYAKYLAEKRGRECWRVVAVILTMVIKESLSENLKIEQSAERSEGVSCLII